MAKTISGRVVASDGTPIQGASVVVKNISGQQYGGVAANGDGGFVTQVPDNDFDYYTEVSAVGYNTSQYSPATKAQGNIILSEKDNLLDEVIVVFKKKKVDRGNRIIPAAIIILFVSLAKRFI